MDVFMGELFHSYDHKTRDRSSILTGTQRRFPYKFLRSEFYYTDVKQEGSRCDRRAVFLDYNIDGRLDVLVDNSGYPPQSRLILFSQNDDKSFEDLAESKGLDILNPSGTVKIDINEDGLWDFITGQTSIRNAGIKKRIYVFQNNFDRENRKSIRFYLQGKKSNRDGLGAMLIFRSKFETMRRWISYAHGSFPSQNEKGVIFGMEEGDSPLMVNVRWPYKIINKKGRVSVLTRDYTFNRLKLENHKDITLCEDGTWLEGKVDCK